MRVPSSAKICKAAFLLASAGISLTANGAQAQDGGDGTASRPPGNAVNGDQTQPGDIVVTALRRETSLLQTPAALTAIDGDTLRDKNITSLADIASAVPNLKVGGAAGVSLVTIRGISLDALIGGIEGSIAIHRDNVYLSQSVPLNFLMMDVGSVEVLRGPQGTLYGRNATGGAINVTPAKPTRELSGYVNLSVGNLGTYREEAAISGPLIEDKLLFRIAGMAQQRVEGYARNSLTGEKLGTGFENGVRGSLQFLPAANLDFRLEGFYFAGHNKTDFWTNIQPYSASQLAANPDFLNYPISFDPRHVQLDFTPEDSLSDKGMLFIGSWDISPTLNLRSSTSYTDLKYVRGHADCDGTAIPTCSSSRADRSKSFQQEVDLKLKSDGLNWLLGIFYDYDKASGIQLFPFSNPQGFVSVNGVPVPNGLQTEQIYTQRTKSIAAFTDVDFRLAPWLSLYGGARYSHDTRAMTLTSGLGVTGTNAIVLGCTDLPQEVSYSNVSGKAGIQLRPDSRSQFYGQWQQGFKAGGFNAATCGSSFKPEKITAYEIGYKGRFFDSALTLAIAAFHYDYTDLQTAQITGLTYSITNAASAKVDGAELEATLTPAEGFQIDGHASLLNARYGAYSNYDPIDPAAGLQNLTGKKLNRAPRFSGALGLQYSAAIGEGELTLRGELEYTSSYYFRPFNEPLDRQDGYATGNAFISYALPGGGVELRGFVRNIADRTIIAGIFTSDIGQTRQAQYQEPRTYGMGVNFRSERGCWKYSQEKIA